MDARSTHMPHASISAVLQTSSQSPCRRHLATGVALCATGFRHARDIDGGVPRWLTKLNLPETGLTNTSWIAKRAAGLALMHSWAMATTAV